MTVKTCSRLWEVEAAHIGQLTAAQRASQREHRSGCPECTDAANFLEHLKRDLSDAGAFDDDVACRRLRQVTLERADAWRRGRTSGSRWGNLGLFSAVVGAALCIGWLAARAGSVHNPVVVVTAQAEPGAWSHHRGNHVERIELREGVFSLAVRRKADDPRVVVEIPEGEIEDVGTVFSVTVHAGHTMRIAVSQGAVILRRAGLPELRLLAGSAWEPVPIKPVVPEPPLEPTAVAEAAAPSAALPLQAVTPEPAPQQRMAAAAAQSCRTALAPPKTTGLVAPVPVLADEDASYLRFVQLVRQQQVEAARVVGSEYLVRYPNGFRRPEVERILHSRDE